MPNMPNSTDCPTEITEFGLLPVYHFLKGMGDDWDFELSDWLEIERMFVDFGLAMRSHLSDGGTMVFKNGRVRLIASAKSAADSTSEGHNV